MSGAWWRKVVEVLVGSGISEEGVGVEPGGVLAGAKEEALEEEKSEGRGIVVVVGRKSATARSRPRRNNTVCLYG